MRCHEHIADADKLGYTAWHEKATKSARRGQKQRQCSECNRWFWPWEVALDSTGKDDG